LPSPPPTHYSSPQRGATQPLNGGATTRLLAETADLAAPPSAGPGYDDLGFTAHLLADATGASAVVPRPAASGGAAAPTAAAAALSPAPVTFSAGPKGAEAPASQGTAGRRRSSFAPALSDDRGGVTMPFSGGLG
jgi:hypothetical protein